ncbi:CLUMA_CG020388, isoform A [Clunio marinus]|uniref:CLUMA_CG020388, isoform A n=1 Tax=Clunio marinus TaxID=568069 RepID=A0A1J1J4U8_9DIPT|nr:CLUMA_CG020388, isoform A [Clunio marinus]
MEYSVLLLLLSVVLVQGYRSDFNQTVLSEHRNNRSFNESLIGTRSKRNHNKKEFDEAFNYYNNGIPSKREPKFISFQTVDDNIEIELDYSIPFLSIPVRQSIDTVLGAVKLTQSSQNFPLGNLNIGVVIFFVISVFAVAIFGGTTTLKENVGEDGANPDISIFPKFPWLPYYGHKSRKGNDDAENHSSWQILNQIDQTLHRYGVDTASCVKRATCWQVKESLSNIYDKNATSFDYIITDLASSTMIQQFISSTSWNDAIIAARKDADCMSTFPNCVLSSSSLISLWDRYLMILANSRVFLYKSNSIEILKYTMQEFKFFNFMLLFLL